MRLKLFISVFFVLIYGAFCNGQSCAEEIDICAQLIKKNYAGFYDKTDDLKFDKFVNSIRNDSSIKDCFYKISLLTGYFNDEHLIVQDTSKNWLKNPGITSKIDPEELRKKIIANKHKDNIVDYWKSTDNKLVIAIIRMPASPDKYAAYVVENKRGRLPPGHLKFLIQKAKGKYHSMFLSENQSRIVTSFFFKSKNTIQAGSLLKLHRVKNYSDNMLGEEASYSLRASFKQMGNGTNLLKVPAGSFENIAVIDSILAARKQELESGRNLIIDLRDNGGGSILPLMRLLKYLYTNPFKDIESKILCSEDVIEKTKELLEGAKKSGLDSVQLGHLKAAVDSVEKNRGGWYYVKPEITRFDTVYKYPEKVAVIMNFACRSATELMILRFRQSKKVTLFGENTYGAVDYLEFLPYSTPVNKYILRIARTKRIIPAGGKKFDNTGIAPDIRINLPEEKWVDFVRNYLK